MRLWRYCIAGLLFNWLGFVFWTMVPIRASEFHATSTQLALLQTASSVIYVLNSLFMGRLSDRASRSLLARLACGVGIAACALTIYINSLSLLYLVVPLMGLAGSVYWPGVQGAVGAESGPAKVEKAIGWFNVSWSVGKTLGFAVAGLLAKARGNAFTLWSAAAAAVPILFLYPGDKHVRWEESHAASGAHRGVFRTIGYVANFMAFGMGAAFTNQFLKYLTETGVGSGRPPETLFGLFLGAMYGAQTVLFVVLQRGTAWTYRRELLYGFQLLAGTSAVGVTLLSQEGALLGAAALIGVGLGFTNASSIYYSLHGPSDHGKYAGLHEAVLGAGTFLVPLAGGAMADLFGDLRMPYWLAGTTTLVAIAVEEILYRRRPSS